MNVVNGIDDGRRPQGAGKQMMDILSKVGKKKQFLRYGVNAVTGTLDANESFSTCNTAFVNKRMYNAFLL